MIDLVPFGLVSSVGFSFAEFVGTGLLHSSILLSGAWLVSRRLESRPRLEELVWRVGIVGSVLTTLLASWSPLPSSVDSSRIVFSVARDVPAIGAFESREQRGPSDTSRGEDVSGQEMFQGAPAADAPWTSAETVLRTAESQEPSRTAEDSGPGIVMASSPAMEEENPKISGPGWWLLLAGYAWLAGVLLLLAREAKAWLILRRVFDERVTAPDEESIVLEQLRRQSEVPFAVRLSVSPRVPGPVALPGREICVPPRFFRELGPEEQRAALAHELAHIVRRDPAWGIWVRVARVLLFVQVLARVGERRLATLAEVNSDDWAADRSGAGSLASSLSVIAGWCASTPSGAGISTAGLAREARSLPYRVKRLLSGSRSSSAPLAGGTTAISLVGILLLGLALPSLALEVRAGGQSSDRVAPPQSAVADPVGSTGMEGDSGARDVDSSSASLTDRWDSAGEIAVALGHEEVTVRYSVPVRAPQATGPNRRVDRVVRARALPASEDGSGEFRLAALSVGPAESRTVDGSVLDVGLVHPDSSARWMRDRVAGLSLTGEDPELQRQLVEAIGAHSGEVAEAYLIRLAWIHPLREIRRRAVELIAPRSSGRVLRELDLIAERHPEPELAGEARRALSDHDPRNSLSVLQKPGSPPSDQRIP